MQNVCGGTKRGLKGEQTREKIDTHIHTQNGTNERQQQNQNEIRKN